MEGENILKTTKILTEAELKNELKQFVDTRENRKINNIPKNPANEQSVSVDLILKICLCTPATNCSAERTFSVLKRIKDYLRNKT